MTGRPNLRQPVGIKFSYRFLREQMQIMFWRHLLMRGDRNENRENFGRDVNYGGNCVLQHGCNEYDGELLLMERALSSTTL